MNEFKKFKINWKPWNPSNFQWISAFLIDFNHFESLNWHFQSKVDQNPSKMDSKSSKSIESHEIPQIFQWILLFLMNFNHFNLLIDIFNQKWIKILTSSFNQSPNASSNFVLDQIWTAWNLNHRWFDLGCLMA